MARETTPVKRSIQFSPQMIETIGWLRDKGGMELDSEVLRKVLTDCEQAFADQDEGVTMRIRRPDGEIIPHRPFLDSEDPENLQDLGPFKERNIVFGSGEDETFDRVKSRMGADSDTEVVRRGLAGCRYLATEEIVRKSIIELVSPDGTVSPVPVWKPKPPEENILSKVLCFLAKPFERLQRPTAA